MAAQAAEKVFTGILSPVGRVFMRETDAKDRRRAREQVVVEDLPDYVARIAEYLAQVDQPPPQVLVEARILQVKFKDEFRHGVNLEAIGRLAGADLDLRMRGFATDTGPGMIFSVDGSDLNSLVEALESTTDAKTLANPKVLVLNGQRSKIQIGRRLGYFITTTTQTSTFQDVQFLEVGVVLDVTPYVTNDRQVLLKVKPEVSSGSVNPTTSLPDKETTEVQTAVMPPDGHGIVIGGLIQEADAERNSKLPWLGDLWLIGRLFQRRTTERERNEVIVVLIPRIVPYDDCYRERDEMDFQHTHVPLLTPELERVPRPWEGRLTDAINNPICLRNGGQPLPQ